MSAQTNAPTFLLIHGAWHGGWCWRRVSDRLANSGHHVMTPTLTGLADRSHLLSLDVTLSMHVTDVVNLIKWENLTNVVLVGHSYGGFVISGVAEQIPSAISSIVFLDAFFPESGESLAQAAAPLVPEWIKVAREKGESTIPPPSADWFNVNARDHAWVEAKSTPQPIATFTEKLVLTGARERIAKKAYIRAGDFEFPAFDKIYEKLAAEASWKTYTMPCGHDAMIDMPERLTEILLEMA